MADCVPCLQNRLPHAPRHEEMRFLGSHMQFLHQHQGDSEVRPMQFTFMAGAWVRSVHRLHLPPGSATGKYKAPGGGLGVQA